MKKCTKCKNNKDVSEFCKNRTTNDGYEYWCKECRRNHYGQRPRNDLLNLKDKRSGRLVAIEPTNKKQNNHIVWLCRCDCGNYHKVISSVIQAGTSKSCGCWRRERLTKHKGKGTRLYGIWKLMRGRCHNENHPKYHRYGGRGIGFFQRWNSFDVFRSWALSNGYKENLTIDRIDNDGNYEPSNCQWLTLSENSIKGHIQNPRGKNV